MRAYGVGRVFLRGRIWHMAYCVNGREISETTGIVGEKNEGKANRKLAQKMAEIRNAEKVVGPSEKRLTLEDLEKEIEADYRRHNRRSFETVKHCLKPLKAFFAGDRLVQITRARIQKYQEHRLAQGMTRATANREVRYLLRGFRLLIDGDRLSTMPKVKLLEGENVRENFLGVADFAAVLSDIKDEDTRDIVAFLYNSAWRSGEAKRLEWSKVNTTDWVVSLARKNSKNKKPRTLVLVGELREILERRLGKRLPDCTFVFHRGGKPIKAFRTAFKSAATRVGLEAVPHDMRRSGVRNLRRAGNDERDCMEISGHKTRAIFDRYDIVDEDDQRRALERQEAYKREQLEQGRKVVPIKRVG